MKLKIRHPAFWQCWIIYCTVDNRTECPISISQSMFTNCFMLLRNLLQMSSCVPKHGVITEKHVQPCPDELPTMTLSLQRTDGYREEKNWVDRTDLCAYVCVCRGTHSWQRHGMHACRGHGVFRVLVFTFRYVETVGHFLLLLHCLC